MSTPGESRRVLITGGAGFIGSHLAEVSAGRGDHVTIIDDLSTGRRGNLSAVPTGRLRFIEGTVTGALESLATERFDEIYHLAAAVGVRLILDRPIETIETNVVETARVLHFAARHGTPILLASSSEVYGKSTKVPFREDDDVVYGATRLTRWSYACTKAIDEYLGLAFHRTHGLPVVIARFFNTVGPRQVGTYGMVLPRFVEKAMAGQALPVYGDGKQSRCFCDVRDVAAVLPVLVAKRACHGRVFNVGSDRLISILELARLVIEQTGGTSAVEIIPYDRAYGAGFEDLAVRQPDLTQLRRESGFAPRIGLPQTIRDLADEIGSRSRAGETRREDA